MLLPVATRDEGPLPRVVGCSRGVESWGSACCCGVLGLATVVLLCVLDLA